MKDLNDQRKEIGGQMDALPQMKPGKPIKFPEGVAGFGKLLQNMAEKRCLIFYNYI